jgi:acyl-homoserine lactone acylase PvdQ
MQVLRSWDYRFSANSVATSLAIFWANTLRSKVKSQIPDDSDQLSIIDFMAQKTKPHEKLEALYEAVAELQRTYGNWRQPWGEINRFQRLTGKIESTFDDNQQSLTIPFTSSFWGSLASFGAKQYPGTKKMYGSVGNSFVAVVEFGSRVTAKSVTTGGSSSDPASKHFFDQGQLYAQVKFKDILFYKEDVIKNAERTYKPGE